MTKRPRLQTFTTTEEDEMYLPNILNEETQPIHCSNYSDDQEEPRKDSKIGRATKHKKTSTMKLGSLATLDFSTSPLS